MPISRDVFMKFWMEPQSHLVKEIGKHGMGLTLWFMTREDAYVVTDDLLPHVREDYPWLAEHLTLFSALNHHRMYFGPSCWEVTEGDRINQAQIDEFRAKFPTALQDDDSFLFSEFIEAEPIPVDEMSKDPEDAMRRIKEVLDPHIFKSLLDAMGDVAEKYGYSVMRGGDNELISVAGDGKGGSTFNKILGNKAIDAEVEKFKEEMDSAFDGWGGGGDSQ